MADGRVDMVPFDMVAGYRHKMNDGSFLEVVDYKSAHSVDVVFDSGFTTSAMSFNIRNGSVKDKLRPSIYGVGFIGDGIYGSNNNGKKTAAYKKWFEMIRRCYDHSGYQVENSSYVGCSVCSEWHNFQNFAEWFYSQENSQCDDIELDKDSISDGNKVYSPDLCLLISKRENIIASKAAHASLVSPSGDIVSFFNISQFCRDNGLSQPNITSVLNGRRKSHKGWRKP